MSAQRESPPPTRLLRIPEVAERLRVSRRTVQAWIASGRLRVVRLGRRCVRVDPAELARFLGEASR
jgi:excisionase family DNA binding protein